MTPVADRFLRYISIDTTSCENTGMCPSTAAQYDLANLLADDMRRLGLQDVEVDAHAYVMGTLPANTENAPVIGLISHMDTSPAASGKDIHPQIIEYQGGDILLNKELGITMTEAEFPFLADFKGQTLITTDGTTLLGADDKAGIAEILETCAYLIAHPEIPHGTIRVGFTPDEEIGAGASFFDVKKFGADFAYTVDGGLLGEIEYENFNGATVTVDINGVSIHTGSGKGKLKNALLYAHEFQSMVPAAEIPACTENYEGFYHLRSVEGGVEHCHMIYNLREHDHEKFWKQKDRMESIASYMNHCYGDGTVELHIHDTMKNMREPLESHMELIDKAKAAFLSCGITPSTPAIRGGTDGARLTFMGLPCPNLSTGGLNFHGRYEFIPIPAMESMVLVLANLVSSFA